MERHARLLENSPGPQFRQNRQTDLLPPQGLARTPDGLATGG